MKKSIIITFLILMLAFAFASDALAAATTVSVADSSGAKGDKVKVPINVAGASNIGAMGIVLRYDPSVLKGITADSGALAANAMVESNEINSGYMRISFADSRGISGDGTILEVSFEVVGETGTSTQIAIEATGYDKDLLDVPLETAPGTFRVVEKSMGMPILPIIIAVAVIIVLLILVIVVKKISKKKKEV